MSERGATNRLIRNDSTRARARAVARLLLFLLEAAKALKDLELETHVLEFAPRLMAAQFDEAAGRVLRTRIGEYLDLIEKGRDIRDIRDDLLFGESAAAAG